LGIPAPFFKGHWIIHAHPHPGEILKETVFAPLELSVTEAAGRLSRSRVALSRVLNGKTGISPDLALRLEKAGVGTARLWVNPSPRESPRFSHGEESGKLILT